MLHREAASFDRTSIGNIKVSKSVTYDEIIEFFNSVLGSRQFADTIFDGNFPSTCCTHKNNIIFISNGFNRTFLEPRIIFPPPEQRARIEKKFQPSSQTLISASGSG